MIKTIKSVLLKFSIVALLAAPVMVPALAHAAPATGDPINNSLCSGTNLSTDGTCADTTDTDNKKVNGTVTLVINLFSIIVGIVAVIMIVVGGLKYITSSGESSNVTGAKNTILYAVVGLVVVALAQFIVRFVLGKVNS